MMFFECNLLHCELHNTLYMPIYIVYAVIFESLIFRGRQVCKDYHSLIFTDHQVEHIVSLCHYFFLRIKISRSASLQQNPQSLRPSKITAFTVT